MNILKSLIEKIKRKIKASKFKKVISKEKSKLYMTYGLNNNICNTNIYKSKRNKFSLFKAKLEYANTFREVKDFNFYYLIMGIFLILSSFYILFFSHYFSIKNIDIINQDNILNLEIAYKSIDYIRYKSILTEDKEKIKENLLKFQPSIKNIYIRKTLPDNIKIIIESYSSNLWFEKNGKNYLITQNGVTVPTKSINGLTKINVSYRENSIIDYKEIFKKSIIEKINNIITYIKEKNSFVNISDITYYAKEYELHITNKDGMIIIFDLTKDYKVQIEKLNLFYKKYQNEIKSGVVYIDLRINEKIFYCLSENEKKCSENLKNLYK